MEGGVDLVDVVFGQKMRWWVKQPAFPEHRVIPVPRAALRAALARLEHML